MSFKKTSKIEKPTENKTNKLITQNIQKLYDNQKSYNTYLREVSSEKKNKNNV